jgi:hypothetical protein
MLTEIELLDLSIDERHTLARKAKITPIYLWQCGAGIRTPRLKIAEKLMKHEPRLSVSTLMAPYHRRVAKQAKLKRAKLKKAK